MKINEIATRHLNEAPPGITPAVKYVGPYFDKAAAAAAKLYGVGKGSTQAELDALRAADTGAAKAAGKRPLSTVSKDELNALLYPPVTPAPAVGSFLKRRGDTGFDPDLSKTQALPGYLQNLPPARIVPVTRPSPSGPRPRPQSQPAPELGNMEPDLQVSPAAAEIGQIRPGVETPTSAAAQAAAEKAGIPWKSILAGGAAIGALQGGNALYPDTIPSAGQLIDKGVTKLSTLTADPDGAGPPPGERAYDFKTNDSDSKTSGKNSSDAPPASNIDDIKDTDAFKKALKQALDGEKIDESTAALNRMVYLSRL